MIDATLIKRIQDSSGTKRVDIFQRADGTFGFIEYHWTEEETPVTTHRFWNPVGPRSAPRIDTAERAEQEARGRVGWLASGSN